MTISTPTIISISLISAYLLYVVSKKNEFFPWYSRIFGLFKPTYKIKGDVDEEFKDVEDIFKKAFLNGEEVGSSVSVYSNGKLKVELYGGYANFENGEEYTSNTLNLVYSSSKFMATCVIARLVDQGLLTYDQKVVEIWPEFGKSGKEEVTISDVLKHEAGIPYFDDPQPSLEEVYDHKKLKLVLENQKHVFDGERVRCYHGVTRGLILNEISRLVDPQHRSIGQIYRQEINKEFDMEFYLGLNSPQLERRAKWYMPSIVDLLASLFLPKVLVGNKAVKIDKRVGGSNSNMSKVNKFKYSKDKDIPNATDWHKIELPSINGFTNSKTLAKMANIFANRGKLDDKVFISKETFITAMSEQTKALDQAVYLDFILTKGGFGIFTFDQLKDEKGENIPFYGWGGFGGSIVVFNPDYNFSFAYVTNGCQLEMFGEGRGSKLIIPAFKSHLKTI
ncbi:beta-lactamase/transpeptidase-like protein [Neoconidiobolus thromboides FSU 785]|nr:beta-lactamase/transpeptidase-like protein [Neoconidiobolus thromboides FSU 785]